MNMNATLILQMIAMLVFVWFCMKFIWPPLLKAMDEHFPSAVTWTRPQGGLFLWVRLPDCLNADKLLEVAVEEKVAFIPGTAFYSDGESGRNAFRLTFATASPEMIEEGIRRLGKAIERQLARTQ